MSKVLGFLSLLMLFAALPETAYAYSNLTCQGTTPVGELYDTAHTCSGINSLSNIFSGLVCDFQSIIDEVMSRVYCGIQDSVKGPLRLAFMVFVIIFGIQILMGYVQMNTQELVTRLLKITLIWVFATESTVGIGIMYNFFIDAANTGVGWMLTALPMPNPSSAPHPFCNLPVITPDMTSDRVSFRYMDYLICTTITGPFTAQGAALSGFFAVLAYAIPPVFLMFLYFTFKSLAIFIRCLLSYLIGISAIAFMITLSPLFLSLALFRPTYRYFDDWLRNLISFTLQIILIFAGASMWVLVISHLSGFFGSLAAMLRTIDGLNTVGALSIPLNSWGVCDHKLVGTQWGPVLQCTDSWVLQRPDTEMPGYWPEPIKPSQLIGKPDFIFFVVINLLAVCVTAYIFDTLMKMLPGLAKQLAGPGYAPQLGGGGGPGAMNFGKMLTPENAASHSKRAGEAISGLLTKRKDPKANTP